MTKQKRSPSARAADRTEAVSSFVFRISSLIRQSSFVIVISALLTVSGCHAPVTPPPAAPATKPVSSVQISQGRITSISGHRLMPNNPHDPQPEMNAMVHLDVYTLRLPAGTVSDSKEFWKSIDEQAVGVALEDRLYKSGIRTGLAPKSKGKFFSQFFDKQATQKIPTSINALRADTLSIDLSEKLDSEDLFYFDTAGRSHGQTYDQCINSMQIGFGPTTHHPGAVRLTMCPTVKCERQQLQYTSANQEFETPAMDTTVRLYDIAASVDVPEDSFFIIAPSPDASLISSVGGQFLKHDEKLERLEQVIVIVPTLMPMDGKPVDVPDVVQ